MIKKALKRILKWCFSTVSVLLRNTSTMTESEARKNLSACSPMPNGTVFAKNQITEPLCDLQIIIPAYNVEEYLDACLNSILSQITHYNFQILLIDDGSTDRTPEIVDSYAHDPRVHVIHQKNRGFSGARNTGLSNIFGKYLMFVDSDDMICPGAIDKLLHTAYQYDCDVVEGGAWYLTGTKQTIMYHYQNVRKVNPAQTFHGQPWAKIYRSELFNDICFPEGFWYEDSILSFLVWPVTQCAYVIPEKVYIHRRNPSGITISSQGRPKSVDTYWITEMLINQYLERGFKINEEFLTMLLDQIQLNQHRIRFLDKTIQESQFILTCCLIKKYIPQNIRPTSNYNLFKALLSKNFEAYRLCCLLY